MSEPGAGANLNDPENFLQGLIALPPSKESLVKLAGTTATFAKRNAMPQIAALYLKAANQHWGSLLNRSEGGETWYSQHQKDIDSISEAISASAKTVTPKSIILETGILNTMASYLFASHSQHITIPHIEFLQSCIHAEQFPDIGASLNSSWPRPKGISAKNVLRYFYLRGVVHLGCNDLPMAIRCFWTCLSVPAETPSDVAISAWKKLVLVQCLLQSEKGKSKTRPLLLPHTIGTALKRALDTPVEGVRSHSGRHSQPEMALEAMHMVEAADGELGPSNLPRFRDSIRKYKEIVDAYVHIDLATFNRLLGEHQALLEEDGNLGIAKRCGEELVNRKIFWLSRTYSAISLDDLVRELTVPGLPVPAATAVSDQLNVLGVQKSWDVQVRDGIIYFPPLKPSFPDEEQIMQDMLELTNKLQTLDFQVAMSSKYKNIVKEKSSSDENAPEAAKAVSAAGPTGEAS